MKPVPKTKTTPPKDDRPKDPAKTEAAKTIPNTRKRPAAKMQPKKKASKTTRTEDPEAPQDEKENGAETEEGKGEGELPPQKRKRGKTPITPVQPAVEPKKKARKPEKEQEAAASSAVKPGKGSKARKGKGKGKQEDADGEEQIPEEEVEEDEENPRKGLRKGKGKVRGNDRVAACFARRRCPDGGVPKAKWLSLRSAFEKIVKIHLKTYSSHEAFQLKFKIRVKKKQS